METSWLVEPPQAFDFGLSLAYLLRRSGELVDRVEGERYRRLLPGAGGPLLLQVQAEGAGLRVAVPWSEGTVDRDALTCHVARVFSLDAPLADFYRDMGADPIMAAVTRRFRGLRPVLAASPFEALVWAIIGQQITLSFAFTLKGRLVTRYGAARAVGGEAYFAFPSADALAGASVEELRGMQFSGRKAEYVVELAQGVAWGAVDLEDIGTLPAAEALDRLTRIRGIGPWTAEYALMRGVGAPDALPAADIGLRNAVTRAYGLGHQATEAEVRALGERWRPWRGYAAFYLWATLWMERRDGNPPGAA